MSLWNVVYTVSVLFIFFSIFAGLIHNVSPLIYHAVCFDADYYICLLAYCAFVLCSCLISFALVADRHLIESHLDMKTTYVLFLTILVLVSAAQDDLRKFFVEF